MADWNKMRARLEETAATVVGGEIAARLLGQGQSVRKVVISSNAEAQMMRALGALPRRLSVPMLNGMLAYQCAQQGAELGAEHARRRAEAAATESKEDE